MKKRNATLLLSLMLIVSALFSQDAIKRVTIDFEVAKEMHLDLLDYDRLIANDVEGSLYDALEIITQKDSLNKALNEQLALWDQQLYLCQNRNILMKKEMKRSRNRARLYWSVGGFSVGVVGLLLLLP